MDKMKYICIKDLQGGTFAVGCVETIENWQKIALNWCDSDGNYELYNYIKKLNEKHVINEIREIWQLKIIPVTELDIERMFELVEKIMYYKLPLENISNILNENFKTKIIDTLETAKEIYNDYINK